MVASKRCKICAVLDSENIPISGDYFGKLLPDLIEKTCGIELDPRKANGVLVCKLCVIQLLQTDLIIEKLRSSLQRLKKLVKEKKPKTPSKAQAKKTSEEKIPAPIAGGDELEFTDDSDAGDTDLQTRGEPRIQKKVERRKSVFLDGEKIATSTTDTLQTQDKIVVDGIDSQKMVKIKHEKKTELKEASNGQSMKTPKVVANTTFKKILDIDVDNIKKSCKVLKRKLEKSTSNALNKTTNNVTLNGTDVFDTTTLKHKKTNSLFVSEDSQIELNVRELQSNAFNYEPMFKESKVKVLNCIICAKEFKQKSALRGHIDNNHIGEKLKTCPHCSSEFRSQQKYESHVFNEKCKNTNYACQYPMCNKRFKTIHKMELHMHDKHSFYNESEAD